MPLALAGSLKAVQICYPADLSLTLNKIGHFSKVSDPWGIAMGFWFIFKDIF